MDPSHAILPSHYDYRLVACSVLIAVAASYAAFDLAGRVTASRRWPRFFWLMGGAAATGIGTWSMHYVGMLAFLLPVPIQYNWPTALLSLLAAFLSYVVALLVAGGPHLGKNRVLVGGAVMGGGIVALHYTAMDSMRLSATCHYSPPLVALSVLVAVAGSQLALWLVFSFRNAPTGRSLRKIGASMGMGVAIAGMHYTAMAASSFTPSGAVPDLSHAVSVTALGVAGMVIVPPMVLWIAVLTSMVDRLQQSFDQLRALGGRLETIREEERRRIAREIHDELGQALTAMKIELDSLSTAFPDAHPSSKRVASLVSMIDQTIASLRRIATELRPAILDDLGLADAIEWAAEEFERRTGTKVHLNLPRRPLTLTPERTTAMFRIFQETLTNIARHAQASEVHVQLAAEDSSLLLEVRDNGTGISEEKVSGHGSLGILGMRERALLLGGELAVGGGPGQGTWVRVRIPLP